MNPILNQEIAKLSPLERIDLIGEIWDALDDEPQTLTSAQGSELTRRLDTLDQERGHAVPWESVKAELNARIRN